MLAGKLSSENKVVLINENIAEKKGNKNKETGSLKKQYGQTTQKQKAAELSEQIQGLCTLSAEPLTTSSF